MRPTRPVARVRSTTTPTTTSKHCSPWSVSAAPPSRSTPQLRRRFGDDAPIPAIAAALARLPDEERLNRIADAGDLDG